MKVSKLDVIIPIFFLIALIVLYFHWECKWDLYITVLAVLLLAVSCITKIVQYREIKRLTDTANVNK